MKADSSDNLKNLYSLAQRARQNGDSGSAAMYYEQIALADPGNWEAVFFHAYYHSVNCSINEIASAANALADCIPTVFHLLLRQYPENTDIRHEICGLIRIRTQLRAYELLDAAKSHYESDSAAPNALSELIERGTSCTDLLITLGASLTEIGEYGEALKSYKSARKWAYGTLDGKAYVESGRKDLIDAAIRDACQKQYAE